MNTWSIVGIAVGLAMDALAVSIAAGLKIRAVTGRHVFRAGFHFGLFQFIMPVIGWLAGSAFAGRVGSYSHGLAFALLSILGGKMLWESRSSSGQTTAAADPTRGWSLITLSIATSLDALAVGVSLALLGVSIWIPSLIIGLVAAGLSAAGVIFGARLGARWEQRAEAAGGVILIGIGVKILVGSLAG